MSERTRDKLLTTLTLAKQELAQGRPVPLTPLPPRALEVVQAEYVPQCPVTGEPGAGALVADEEKGLRCPVCGEWFLALRRHLNQTHADVGGARRILPLLSIPRTAAITAAKTRAKYRRNAMKRIAEGKLKPAKKGQRSPWKGRRGRASPRGWTMHERNLRNSCEAQIIARIVAVRDRIGRSPSRKEADLVDPGLSGIAINLYGTWNSAKARADLEVIPQYSGEATVKYSRAMVLEALSAWYEAHGDLPTQPQHGEVYIPFVPDRNTVLRWLGKDSWPDAMRLAASILGIRGGRYGLPEKKQEAA